RRGIVELAQAWPYVRTMLLPAVGFGFAYLSLVIEFASAYAVLARVDPGGSFLAEALAGPPLIGDFLFFSLSTMTTLGYSPLTPVSPIVQVLSSLEVLAGITLLTVGFAAVLAHLDQRFSFLAGRTGDASSQDIRELREAV